MTSGRPGSLDSVPTLTEVVTVPTPGRPDGAGPAAVPPPEAAVRTDREPAVDAAVPARPVAPPETTAEPATGEATAEPVIAEATAEPAAVAADGPVAEPARLVPSEEELTLHILADLQRQVDAVLEYRVRELLTPILSRATDAVVREARSELARSLRDVVARSVTEELRRQRLR